MSDLLEGLRDEPACFGRADHPEMPGVEEPAVLFECLGDRLALLGRLRHIAGNRAQIARRPALHLSAGGGDADARPREGVQLPEEHPRPADVPERAANGGNVSPRPPARRGRGVLGWRRSRVRCGSGAIRLSPAADQLYRLPARGGPGAIGRSALDERILALVTGRAPRAVVGPAVRAAFHAHGVMPRR